MYSFQNCKKYGSKITTLVEPLLIIITGCIFNGSSDLASTTALPVSSHSSYHVVYRFSQWICDQIQQPSLPKFTSLIPSGGKIFKIFPNMECSKSIQVAMIENHIIIIPKSNGCSCISRGCVQARPGQLLQQSRWPCYHSCILEI